MTNKKELEYRKSIALDIVNRYKDDINYTKEDIVRIVQVTLDLKRYIASRLVLSLGIYKKRDTTHHIKSDSPDTYICPKCNIEKSLSEFPKKGKTRKGQARYSYCKPCHSEYQREKRINSVFGLTLEQFDMLGEYCPICNRKGKTKRNPVDHEHKTGRIRGRICSRCNRGLAWFQDNPDLLRRCAEYLENPPAPKILGIEVFGRKGRVSRKKKKIRSLLDLEEPKNIS